MRVEIVLGWLLPAVPFGVALAGLLLPQRSRAVAAGLGIAGAAVSLVVAVFLLVTLDGAAAGDPRSGSSSAGWR